jgi:hypothetical protein
VLGCFDAQAKLRFDDDAEFKLRAQRAVVTLQAGDADSLALWRSICDVSRVEFQALYDRLGVRLTERGESFYNAAIPAVLDELTLKAVAEVNLSLCHCVSLTVSRTASLTCISHCVCLAVSTTVSLALCPPLSLPRRLSHCDHRGAGERRRVVYLPHGQKDGRREQRQDAAHLPQERR